MLNCSKIETRRAQKKIRLQTDNRCLCIWSLVQALSILLSALPSLNHRGLHDFKAFWLGYCFDTREYAEYRYVCRTDLLRSFKGWLFYGYSCVKCLQGSSAWKPALLAACQAQCRRLQVVQDWWNFRCKPSCMCWLQAVALIILTDMSISGEANLQGSRCMPNVCLFATLIASVPIDRPHGAFILANESKQTSLLSI